MRKVLWTEKMAMRFFAMSGHGRLAISEGRMNLTLHQNCTEKHQIICLSTKNETQMDYRARNGIKD